MRRLISAGFTPRMIGELEGHIVRRTGQILDAVAEKCECEFVSEVAYQLPMHVIADIMGIPDEDRPWIEVARDGARERERHGPAPGGPATARRCRHIRPLDRVSGERRV